MEAVRNSIIEQEFKPKYTYKTLMYGATEEAICDFFNDNNITKGQRMVQIAYIVERLNELIPTVPFSTKVVAKVLKQHGFLHKQAEDNKVYYFFNKRF